MRLQVLILLAAAGCTASRTYEAFEEPAHYPSAAELKTCPYGHRELKDVPILYGLVFPTDEIVRKQENLEVYLGGCVATDRQTQVICARCRFVHFAEDEWDRRHDDVGTFEVAPVTVVQALPGTAFDGVSPTYRQRMRGGTVVEDGVAMRVEQFEDEVERQLKTYLREQGATDVSASDDSRFGPARLVEARWRDRRIRAELSTSVLGGTYVSVTATPE